MKFLKTSLEGVILIEPLKREDDRGFFVETYKQDLFRQNGILVDFVQDNHSHSKKGVLRGLHYQIAPRGQAKLVRVSAGSVFDVVVDIRPGSKTYGRHESQILSAKNQKILFIPEGFAHGFLALEDDTDFLYKVSTPYSPEHERGLVWNDPSVGIPWPKLDMIFQISDRDRAFPTLKR